MIDMLNIANNGAAEYGNIQISRTAVNSSIVNNILYAIWYDMLNIAVVRRCRRPSVSSSVCKEFLLRNTVHRIWYSITIW